MMFLSAIVSVLALSTVWAGKHSYKPAPIPYQFSYGVNDAYSGLNYDQNENSDGNVVKGSYTVQLPDGRKQIVSYQADHDRGYVADVAYEGQAQYPSHGAPAITFAPQGYH